MKRTQFNQFDLQIVNELKNKFISKGEHYHKQYKLLDKKFNQISIIRIVITLLFLVLTVWFANQRNGVGLAFTLIPFPFIFGILVNYHSRIKFKRNHFRYLNDISQEEIKRLSFEIKKFDPGEKYIDDTHPYSFDFDLFGNHSLFQLLNRSNSALGSAKLASWMLSPPTDIKELQARQDKVGYLKKDVDWRHDFEALGRHSHEPNREVKELLTWVKDRERGSRIPFIVQIFLSLVSLVSLVGFFVLGTSGYFILISVGINIYLLKRIFDELKQTTDRISVSSKALKTFVLLIRKIEETHFDNEPLDKLRTRFMMDGHLASGAIKSLEGLLDRLNSRGNIFYGLVNIVLLIDYLLIRKLDHWRDDNQEHIEDWLDSLSEMECLVSLAGFAYLNPTYSNPVFVRDNIEYSAKNLGHPLIPDLNRVANDFSFRDGEKILIITGSNMSGKSTFLRTVGLNAILAYIGAPVCADEMKISIMEMYTCMRTTDNLEENVSSFYAELKRINGLIKRTENNSIPVLYMLDEILKGTNSADRHKGAEALILQMVDRNARGLISTHDIELGKLANGSKEISNYSFNSDLLDDELVFDYTITDGVCRSFNASQLMKQMGIKVDNPT